MSTFIRQSEIPEIMQAHARCAKPEATAQKMLEYINRNIEKTTYCPHNDRYYINAFFPSFPSLAWERMVDGIDKIVNQDQRIPLQADIVITGRCPCDCWHCFRKNNMPQDLPLERIQSIFEDLKSLGTATVGITGGEPMVRDDILEIIHMIPKTMEGQLFTTGYQIDEKFVEQIKGSQLTRFILSLDHYDREKVAEYRQRTQIFDETVNAIRLLTANHFYTAVTLCVTQELLIPGELEKYMEFVHELNVQEVRITMQIPQGKLEGKPVGRIYGKGMKAVKELQEQYKNKMEYPVITNFSEFESVACIGCGAGSNYISINNNSTVTPCVAVPLQFGSLEKKRLTEIYRHMGDFFPKSDCVCLGIASGIVIARDEIDTSVSPISEEVSELVASRCKRSCERGDFFIYCQRERTVE